MEKRTPHHDLRRVQADVARLGVTAFTKTRFEGETFTIEHAGMTFDSGGPVGLAPRG